MSVNTEAQGKKWLREASMRRLSLFVKNKTELIGNAAQLGMGVLHPDTLEKSGLSTVEIFHLEQWVAGVETGRQCMLAILDNRLLQSHENDSRDQQTINKEDFKPVELIRSLMNLPEDFLCDGGYIYETVFQRAPAGVVREALQMLVQTAFEKSPSQLGIEQINLAIKQLRLNNLGGIAGVAVNSDDLDEGENSNTDETKAAGQVRGTAAEETFRLQIMIELIRIHIVNMNKKRTATDSLSQVPPSEDFTNLDDLLKQTKDEKTDKKGSEGEKNHKIDMHTIEKHLRTPLKIVFEQAGGMSADELEGTNSLLKPYLKQLASLKTSLAAELKDLQDSRAFLALGLSSEASDEAIKKAYRMLAIRLHPDKPGGDTARFQALQDSYQEIMRKRKADSAERAAMEEVRNRYRPDKPSSSTNPSKDKTQKKKEEEGEMGEDEVKRQDSTTEEVAAEEERESQEVPQEECSDEEEEFDDNGDLIVKPEKSVKPVKKDKKDKNLENADENTSDEASIEKKARDLEDADTEDEEEAEEVENDCEDNDDLFADQDIEEVMKGLDGSEDVEEVFRRLSEAKSKTQPAFGTPNGANSSGGSGVGQGKAPVPVSYESEVEHARAVLKQIGEILQRIKKAAGEVTQLAQLNIKWQKLLDRTMEPGNNIKEVFKVLTASTGPKSVLKGNKNSAHNPSNVDACALQQAIMPVELICDWAQQVSALAMELPNLCGVRYAAAASGNKAFINAIERAMHLSLGALKTVLQLINSQEQLASCVRRVKDSIKIAAENEDIQELLLEMIRTGVKSNVITISSTVDRVVETAMAASEVRDQVQQLMKDVERMERAEVKRRAAEQESQQAEDDYCEEDKEALRKCREDRREEDRNMRRNGGDDASPANKDGNKEKNAPESGSLDDLKDKIRLLQVQLKVQHVQALQSMNSEVVLLQGQIIKELQALPFVTSVESLFTDAARTKKTAASSTTSVSTEEPRDFKTSILTLVADLIDSACHALRNDLLSPFPSSESPSSLLSSSSDKTTGVVVDPRDRLNVHFGWMRIVLADGSSFSKTHLDSVAAALAEQSASAAGSSDTEASAVKTDEAPTKEDVVSEPAADAVSSTATPTPTAEPTSPTPTSEEEVSMRLALLPDYRAKTLYLASLVDIAAVHDIIGPQLLQRLEEILLEGKECIARTKLPSAEANTTAEASETVQDGEKSDDCCETKQAAEAEFDAVASVQAALKEVNLNDIDDDCADFNNIDSNVENNIDMHDIDESEYAALDSEIFSESDEVSAGAPLPSPPAVSTSKASGDVSSSIGHVDSAFPPAPPSPRTEDMHRSPGGMVSSTKSASDMDASCKHTVPQAGKGLEGENLKPNNCSPMQA